jgi:hypothetical protein
MVDTFTTAAGLFKALRERVVADVILRVPSRSDP